MALFAAGARASGAADDAANRIGKTEGVGAYEVTSDLGFSQPRSFERTETCTRRKSTRTRSTASVIRHSLLASLPWQGPMLRSGCSRRHLSFWRSTCHRWRYAFCAVDWICASQLGQSRRGPAHSGQVAGLNPAPTYEMAEIYAALGDKEQAFVWLNKAAQERHEMIVQFLSNSTTSNFQFTRRSVFPTIRHWNRPGKYPMRALLLPCRWSLDILLTYSLFPLFSLLRERRV